MSDEIVCVSCGEAEELRSERGENSELIHITCESCGLEWDRDLTPRCPTCDSADVRPAAKAIVDKSRGTQLSIQTMRVVYLCPHCEPERFNDYQQTNSPLPPDEMPV